MNIAILGMGTVGSGVLKVIQENQTEVQAFTQQPVTVTHIFSGTINNQHDADLTNITMTENIEDILNSDVELVVETLGGVDFPFGLHQQFLSKGIHVVSANKDMLAIHIDALAEIGNKNQAQLGYEASCVGGVPIINALTYGLQANKLSRLMGILNGTTNYILDKMTREGADYSQALVEAQEKGYAEKDPTNDVEGYDARRKIALLSRLAYKVGIKEEDIPVKGISSVALQDIEVAQAAGYTLKLLGYSEISGDELSISVEPALLPNTHPLVSVHDAQNAVFVNGNAVGETMFSGPGAGSLETASAIVADIMNIARFGFVENLTVDQQAKLKETVTERPYYLRFADGISSQAIEEALQPLNIEYNVLSNQQAIITHSLSAEALNSIAQNLQIDASYPIIVD